jgi:hypothetical protein
MNLAYDGIRLLSIIGFQPFEGLAIAVNSAAGIYKHIPIFRHTGTASIKLFLLKFGYIILSAAPRSIEGHTIYKSTSCCGVILELV